MRGMQLIAGVAGTDGPFDVGDLVTFTLEVLDDAGLPAALDVPPAAELTDPEGVAVALEPALPDGELTWQAPATLAGPGGIWRVRWTCDVGEAELAIAAAPEGSALPYEATVDGVRARVLDVARPTGGAPVGGAVRPARVPDSRVAEWLLEGGARVGRRLRLISKMGAGESDPIRLEYREAARGLTELYAAALLWDATYPQAAKGDRYGAVLFTRFETGLKDLAVDLALDFEAQLTGGGGGGVDVEVDDGEPLGLTIDPYDLLPGYGRDVVIGGAGASARFPAPDRRISRHRPW